MAAQFSCFAPSGIRFTRRKPRAETIYETLRESWGSLFTDDPTATVNVETFAQAKCLAIAGEQFERATNQATPKYCSELLPKFEKDYRVPVDPNASPWERRNNLVAAAAIRGGARIDSITDGLRAILGASLLAVVPQVPFDASSPFFYPAYPNDFPSSQNNFASQGASFKTFRLTQHAHRGSQTVGYQLIAGDGFALVAGDCVMFSLGRTGLCERAFITSATSTTLSATFSRVHEAGDTCTTAAYPYYLSGRRMLYIVVTDATFGSQDLLQRTNRFMSKTVTHATQWRIVRSSGAGTSGPFLLDSSILDETPIAQVNY